MIGKIKSLWAQGTLKVGLFVLMSRCLGFLRDHVFARILGSSWVFDAFVIAYRIPNMLRDLLAEGALSSVVVSRLGVVEEKEGRERVKQVIKRLMGFWLVALCVVCLLGMALAPWLTWLIAPGAFDDPERQNLVVQLTRIMFPYIGIMALASLTMAVLHHLRFFVWASLGTSTSNIIVISCSLFATYQMHVEGVGAVKIIAVAILLGGLGQWFSQWPGLRKKNISIWPEWKPRDAEVLKVLRLLGPALLGVAAIQANVWVNTIFASFLEVGAISGTYYAFRIFMIPIGVVGVAVSTVLLPTLTAHYAKKDESHFSDDLTRALSHVTFLAIPAVFGLLVLGRDLVVTLYQYGEFDEQSVSMTWLALSGYTPGILAYVLNKNLIQAWYARGDVKGPCLISIFSILVNVCINYSMIFYLEWGIFGLALGTSIVLSLNTFMLSAGLWFRHQVSLKLGSFAISLLTALVAGLLMYCGLKFIIEASGFDESWKKVALATPVGLLFYLGLRAVAEKLIPKSVNKKTLPADEKSQGSDEQD